MAALDELTEAGPSRRCFLLQIQGLSTRYYSGLAPPQTRVDNTGATRSHFYTDVCAIVDVSAIEASFDPVGGIADHSPVSVTIASLDPASESDAINELGRTGARSAGSAFEVVSTIQSSSTVPINITVDGDASGLAYPLLVQVGDETMLASTGTVGGLITIVRRECANSLPQLHEADLTTGDVPLLTDEVVHWRGRRAILSMATARPTDGAFTAGSYVEIFRGFIDVAPEVSDDSLHVTVELKPLTALLDVSFGTTIQEAGLAHGVHYFSDDRGIYANHIQWIRTSAREYSSLTTTNIANGSVNASVPFVAKHQRSFFGRTGPSPLLPIGHPRTGTLFSDNAFAGGGGESIIVTGYGAAAFTCDATKPLAQIPASSPYGYAMAAELHIKDVAGVAGAGTALLVWPEDALAAINGGTTGWAPQQSGLASPHRGDNGKWSDVRVLQRDGGEFGPHIAARSNVPIPVNVAVWSTVEDFKNYDGEYPNRLRNAQWWGLRDPSNASLAIPFSTVDRGASLWYGLSFAPPDGGKRGNGIGWIEAARRGEDAKLPILGAAVGYYQAGERYILADKSITIGSSGSTSIRIEFDDIRSGARRTQVARIVGSTEKKGASGNVVGYLLELAAEHWNGQDWLESFGDWPQLVKDGRRVGTEPVRIQPVIEFGAAVRTSPASIIRQLLTSVNGQAENGSADLLPYGAGIDADSVDQPSIKGFGYPPDLSEWRFRYPLGTPLRDILDPMLRAFGAGLGMVTDRQGRSRLTMFPVGPETRGESVATIDSSSWTAEPQSWGTDDDIRNVFRFNLDFNAEGEPQTSIEVRDRRSIRDNSGEAAEIDFDFLGMSLPDRNELSLPCAFRNLYQRFIFYLSRPKRTWRGRVYAGKALLAGLGGVYTISSDFLKGYGIGVGVSGRTARLRKFSADYWNSTADLEFVHYGTNATGWNYAANVATVPSIDTITIAANAYSDAEHPYTGDAQLDIDGFAAGDTILGVPAGHEDGAAALTVLSVTSASNRIVFTGAHGLAVGDDLWPELYDTAVTLHKTMAYIADAGGTLGAAGDDGNDYA